MLVEALFLEKGTSPQLLYKAYKVCYTPARVAGIQKDQKQKSTQAQTRLCTAAHKRELTNIKTLAFSDVPFALRYGLALWPPLSSWSPPSISVLESPACPAPPVQAALIAPPFLQSCKDFEEGFSRRFRKHPFHYNFISRSPQRP